MNEFRTLERPQNLRAIVRSERVQPVLSELDHAIRHPLEKSRMRFPGPRERPNHIGQILRTEGIQVVLQLRRQHAIRRLLEKSGSWQFFRPCVRPEQIGKFRGFERAQIVQRNDAAGHLLEKSRVRFFRLGEGPHHVGKFLGAERLTARAVGVVVVESGSGNGSNDVVPHLLEQFRMRLLALRERPHQIGNLPRLKLSQPTDPPRDVIGHLSKHLRLRLSRLRERPHDIR
mmetsp:Transcript_17340/g.37718  ORF Transcript_17340/g.37718 Transcript_17340/m.37718 type:complete len:230 (-) Transcript_17340:733-1422(-)